MSHRHESQMGRRETRLHINTLRPALAAAGTFEPAHLHHTIWFLITLALYVVCFVVLSRHGLGIVARASAIVGGAIAMMQFGLFAHEVGHGAVTRNARRLHALGHLSNSFLIGFSFNHWQSSHPVHHNHPNTEGIDPDMESLGYALYDQAALSTRGVPRLIARLQPLTLLLGFLLWGAGIRIAAVIYVARHFNRRTAIDLACIVAHVMLWIGLAAHYNSLCDAILNYAAITTLNGLYMGAILVVPHVGMGSRSSAEELSFFERQVSHSRNYNASWLGTLLCGGLNLQIEHHLLPHIPCVRLRRARTVILGYCNQHNIPYKQIGYLSAWAEVLTHLRRMSDLAASKHRLTGPQREGRRHGRKPAQGAPCPH